MHSDLEKALPILEKGGVILYPTDTIWGIGCDATNEEAVRRIYAIKKRLDSKSMIILTDSESLLQKYVSTLPPKAFYHIRNAKKPLTVIYPEATGLAKNLIAQDGSIGIRIVQDTFCQLLIKKLGKPIVSTSANISGEPAPANFSCINANIINAMDYVVRWRQNDTTRNKHSEIIKINPDGSIEVIRS